MEQQNTSNSGLKEQVSRLQCENNILRDEAAGAEKRYLQLRYHSELNVNLDSLHRHQLLINEILANRENDYQQHLQELYTHLGTLSKNRIVRFLSLIEMFRNPQGVGASGFFGVFCKWIKGELTKLLDSGEYGILNNALQMTDKALGISGQSRHHETEDPVPDNAVDQSKLISVVLPVYNQADMVHESINSILAQTYRNWELIIINDGSTDGLYEKVKPYLSDPRIHYFEQENQRLPVALNNGFSFASGELLTWTSADNNMRPAMLARLAEFLNFHPDIDMVYADYMAIDDKGNPFTAEWFRPHNKYVVTSPYLHLPRTTNMLNMIQDNFIGASFMYRRSTMQLIGEYDNTLGIEDYDYWMRINSMLKISHLGTNEILYDYRVHDNTLNARSSELKIVDKALNLMKYETSRYLFYFRSFDVYGSYDANNFYHGEFPVNYCGRHRDIGKAANGCKQVLMINGKELSQYSFEELRGYDQIAAVFDHGEAVEVGKYAWMIRKFNILCFAEPYSAESEKIDIFTSSKICCTPADALFRFLVYANGRIFIEETRTKESRKRVLPTACEEKTGRIIILLEAIGFGGLEQVAYDMAKSFAKAGKEVILTSFARKPDAVRIPDTVDYIPLDEQNADADFSRLLKEKPCQAVFAHFCISGARTAFEMGVPFFQVVHNTYVWLSQDDIQKNIDADKFTAGYIAVSTRVAHYAVERMRLPANKMMVIENGTDMSRFKQNAPDRNSVRRHMGYEQDEFVLLNPASVYGAKGQINLIRAFAQAYRKNSKLRLIIAGKVIEENYCQDIRNVIKENSLENVVSVGNYYENMADVYAASDAVVLPSFWEGCSLAAAEATFFGKPLLASKVGDIERQTDYENCIIYDLPLYDCTELGIESYGAFIYTPNQNIIDTLADGIIKLAAGDYSKSEKLPESAQSADEAYSRYLRMLNYYGNKISVSALRHNI